MELFHGLQSENGKIGARKFSVSIQISESDVGGTPAVSARGKAYKSKAVMVTPRSTAKAAQQKEHKEPVVDNQITSPTITTTSLPGSAAITTNPAFDVPAQ
jgi:hypothetical protein